MERYPLIDEFAVIDSGSVDKTLEVASNFGADVYLASIFCLKLVIRKEKVKTFGKQFTNWMEILFVMWMQTSQISTQDLYMA